MCILKAGVFTQDQSNTVRQVSTAGVCCKFLQDKGLCALGAEKHALDIQVLDLECMLADEVTAFFDVAAHQYAE